MMRRWEISVDLRAALFVVGTLLKWLSLTFLLPLLYALIVRENLFPYVLPGLIALGGGWLLERATRTDQDIRWREGFLVVALVWLLVAFLGALPFVLWGTLSPLDAYFEAMSGFTTTGATVIAHVEELPRSLLLWRAFTQWLGGMGIIVLAVAILSKLGVGGTQLMDAEAPGPTLERLTPRIRETARLLWGVYVGCTLLNILLLMACGLSWFDATAHAFTTISTGGFSTRDAGFTALPASAQWVTMLFMTLGGLNFALLYRALLRRQGAALLQETETRFYVGLLLGATLVLWVHLGLGWENLRHSAFQAISIMTTTGYASTDFDRWAPLGKMVLLLLMFLGGCSGSTAGSIKVIRTWVVLRFIGRETQKVIHPRVVRPIRVSGRVISEETVRAVAVFSIFYITIFALGSLLVLIDFARRGLEISILEAASAVAATLGNVGPGFGMVGPMSTYADLPTMSKALLIFLMWAGRLEIFPVIVLFMRSYWKG
ncbi:MAG: TrkH family potassium uptake protein [Candidatus Bipolaricaulota bacterium]|nr:TrkH family potassium uptake protein [Candidatus Bipolaricaulota bacterium]MCS7275233.1 TrkH family potassium uptake protein [Candidatus Bipolaricaulota bacterium]MDW8111065.1 TrkH family potassium uptake protein [Candidatus Bipolaricaulota bacterium]MDW8329564.1 TrkH family potassium uptake protein [Candidatus Bipolaricaulota bacterium]